MGVLVTWEAPTVDDAGVAFDPNNVSYYIVLRDGVQVGGQQSKAARSWPDDSPSPPAGAHSYEVYAVSVQGQGLHSDPASVEVPSGIPGKPTNVTATLI